MSAHPFKKWDTVFWADPDDGACSGDYTVIDVTDDVLTLEADDGSEVEALPSECTPRDWMDVKFPNWALSYFVNGDASSLTDEEVKQVDAYVKGLRDEGYTLENVTEDRDEFTPHPAFGLATDTTRVRFYKPMAAVDFGTVPQTVTAVVEVDDGEIVSVEAIEVKEDKA